MHILPALKRASTKPDLANLIGIKPQVLTHCLYVVKTETQYSQFKIPKRNGGERIINAPQGTLKTIQSLMSNLLLNCLDEINHELFPNSKVVTQINKNKVLKVNFASSLSKQPSLSHGFERNRSIITNAIMHIGNKNVLNIDLENFFGSFNFGRVRGFFIKNKYFQLNPEVATLIAKIACHNNELPQGSPCSPVIANLITHSLDIKLSKLASENSSFYTRYADDITFSTRESNLSQNLAIKKGEAYIISKRLRSEISRSGFRVNNKKTRNQYQNSRQEVTGLIVNKKPNIKIEYWRKVRAQCYSLFKTGSFTEEINGEIVSGNINSLEGKLNHIDHLDYYNRLRQAPPLNPEYQTKKEALKNNAKPRRYLHNGRENTFSQFLFYRYFYANKSPTILTEGKTDIIYLKSAIKMLASSYPRLASEKTKSLPYKLLVHFFKYTRRTRYLLELYGGGDYLRDFVKSYTKQFKYYEQPKKPENPVIIIVDNDSGSKNLKNYVNNISNRKVFPKSVKIEYSDFVYIFHNLYLIFTPKEKDCSETDIECLFTNEDRLRMHNGKCFNTVTDRDTKKDLSKDSFARNIIQANKTVIDFSNFKILLDRINSVLEHYDSLK